MLFQLFVWLLFRLVCSVSESSSMSSRLTLSVRESLSVVFNVLLPPSLLLLPVLLVLLLSFVVPWVLLLETVFEMDVEIWNDSTLLPGKNWNCWLSPSLSLLMAV